MSFKSTYFRVGAILAATGLMAAPAVLALDRAGMTDTETRRIRGDFSVLQTNNAEQQRIERENRLGLEHSMVRDHLKVLEVPFDMDATLAQIEATAVYGTIDHEAIYTAKDTILDQALADKVHALLNDYAAWLVYAGQDPEAPLPPVQSVGDLNQPMAAGNYSVPGDIPGTLAPNLGGVCRTCPNFDFGPFTPTAATQTHSSSTSGSGDCNWYNFNVTPGQNYEFTTCSPGSASFDTVIEVWNATSCVMVASNDDSCGLQSRISYCVPAGVTSLRVKMRGFGSSSGSYTMAYRQVGSCTVCSDCTSPSAGTITPTGVCQFVAGATNTSCPSNYYTLNLQAGKTYQFITTSSASCAGRACSGTATYDSYIYIYNPACGLVASNDDCGGLQSFLRYTAPSTGAYRLRMAGFGSGTGSYNLAYVEEGCLADSSPPAINILGPTSVTIDCLDPLPAVPAVSVVDNCDPAPVLTGPTVSTVNLGCPGNRQVTRTWTARDARGNTATASQIINVRDTRPPVLAGSSVELACLWPPNHGMVEIPVGGLTFAATDDCSEPIRYQVVGVTSSQCDDAPCAGVPFENGDGSTTGDARVSEDGQRIFVRAERAGTDPAGRRYMIQVVAIDACGNTSAPAPGGSVVVPHDQSEKSPVPCLSSN